MRALLGGELVNPSISQAFPDGALESDGSAIPVRDGAGVGAEIELGGVAAQVRLAHVMIGAGEGSSYLVPDADSE